MGLGYPGGPLIDKLAEDGDENFHEFPSANVRGNPYDFSFSGIKTSVLYFLKKNFGDIKDEKVLKKLPLNDLSASFRKAVISSLLEKTLLAAKENNVKQIAVSGGVSANLKLKKEFQSLEESGYKIYFPEPEYTTDNAAMIGYTAYLKYKHIKMSGHDWTENLFKPAFARLDYQNF